MVHYELRARRRAEEDRKVVKLLKSSDEVHAKFEAAKDSRRFRVFPRSHVHTRCLYIHLLIVFMLEFKEFH